jgi:hypothetical protein
MLLFEVILNKLSFDFLASSLHPGQIYLRLIMRGMHIFKDKPSSGCG